MAHISARALAHDLINAVLLRGESLSNALDQARRRHAEGEARALAAAQDLSYGVLRAKGRLDFFLGQLLRQAPQPAELRGLLLVGLFELDRPETPDYAAVNEAVNLAGRLYPRAKGLVNAVLRNFQRRRGELDAAAARHPEARWNFPDWWRLRLAEEYPDAWRDMLDAMNRHPPMTLRVNRRVTTPEAYAATLATAGMACRRVGEWALTLAQAIPVRDLPGFMEGWVSVQDLGAQLAAPLLDAAPGMRVLDACAAPGGKTGHLLEAHDLDLLALDSDAARLARVDDNLRRLGLRAETRVGDAGVPRAWWDGRSFERILLDAPCGASGVARRHPDGKWLKRPEDATQLAERQARLLDAVWPLLKPGGKLLYATCSLFKEENEERIEHFLRCHADARREALTLPGGRGGQLLPSADNDGFYYARCVKT
jgi:16S rRNA (cytosine967-C5)-methyltransferase